MKAQYTFELLIEDTLDQLPTSVIETDEHYIFSETSGIFSSVGTKTKLYKIDKQGNIILIKKIKPEEYGFSLSNLIAVNENRITGFGFQKAAKDSVAYFTILEMDDNFSIITEKNYRSGFYDIDYVNIEEYDDGYLIVGSGKYASYPNNHLFSYLVNSSYDTIRSRVYPEEGIIFAFDILPTLDGNHTKIFTRGFVQQTGTMGQIILMDSSLTRLNYKEIPEVAFSYIDAKYIDDTHYLLTGKRDIFNENKQGSKLAIMIMDTADVMQKIELLGPSDTTDYPGFYS